MDVTAAIMMLQTILEIVPQLTDSAKINKVVTMLINLLPIIEKVGAALVGPYRNIIALLAANPATTADALAALKLLDQQTDTDASATITAYLANHPAPAAAANPSQPAA